MYFNRSKVLYGLGDGGDDSSLPFSLVSAATTNITQVKAAPGIVTAIHAVNVNAAIRYLKFYDMATKPVAGAGVPFRRFGIPGSTTGAGFVYAPIVPMKFPTGIAFTLVTGSTDSDATALSLGDVILTLEYL